MVHSVIDDTKHMAKSQAQADKDYRARKKAQGLKQVREWVYPQDVPKMKQYAKELRETSENANE